LRWNLDGVACLPAAQHRKHEGEVFGFFAGLIPCPLTLFVMSLATARGAPAAGLVFAVAMMAGVASLSQQ
jgi:nickel/cobalt transporter (NicO) family protein